MSFVSPARRTIAAALVIFLHYVPQITLYLQDDERYFARWGLGNVGRIAVGAAILTAAAVAIDAALRRWARPWAVRLYGHLFLVALVSGALAAMPTFVEEYRVAAVAIYFAGLFVVAGSFLWKRSPLVRYGSIVCLIFSPLIPILVVQMLFWPRWNETLDPLPGGAPVAQNAQSAHPIFIFVFDEWSWPRSSREGRFTNEFPNMQALSRQATVYSNARSPYWETSQSLPRFIFQTDREMEIHDGRTWFGGQGEEIPTRDCRSLFQAARDAHYQTYMLGFLHAYRHMLGDKVDICRAYFSGDDAGPAEAVCDELLENTRNWPGPLVSAGGTTVCNRLDVKNWRAMVRRYRDDMFRVLRECPRQSMVIFHVPLPHAPFIFNADGSERAAETAEDTGDLDAYRQQLRYVDKLVGEVLDTLRRANKYDDSLIVITSDHGWRQDPDAAMKQTDKSVPHVPLVIKRPGQTSGEENSEPICTNQLSPIVQAAVK